MKIDEVTGLPEVPEGYFWEVVDCPGERYYSESVGAFSSRVWKKEPGYYLQLKTTVTNVTISHTNHRRVRNPEYRFMGKHAKWLNVYDTVEDVEVTEHVVKEKRVSYYHKERFEAAKAIYDIQIDVWHRAWGQAYTDYRTEYDRIYYGNQTLPEWHGVPKPVQPKYKDFLSYTLTEKAVLETAMEIMLEREAVAQRNALVGKYPPNKLNTK